MANPGFLLAEDAALKERLSKVSVVDDRNSERLCQVFYGYPDAEIEKEYPFFTIDLLGIDYANYRQHSEKTWYYSNDSDFHGGSRIDYYPSELDAAGLNAMAGPNGVLTMEQPVAIDLTYQVTSYARHPYHDRQIQAKMLRRVFPWRRGFIEIPEDGTIRRCDLLDWRPSDFVDTEADNMKRIFRKFYTVRINSEIPTSDLGAIQKVLEVRGTLIGDNSSNTVLPQPPISEEFS